MHTEILFVIDESGSMYRRVNSVREGFNTFVQEQREVEGTANVSTITFNSKVRRVEMSKDIQKVDGLNYHPNGNTALYDAIGEGIDRLASRLIVSDNPTDNVLVYVITDGQENMSRKYNKASILRKVNEFKKAGWGFTFFGTEGFEHQGVDLGMDSFSYKDNNLETRAVYSTASAATTRSRTGNTIED